MGLHEDSNDCAKAIGEMLESNQTLIHLDLSNNNFNEHQCFLIGNFMQSNNTLLGIHMEGNQATVDIRGFIKPNSENISTSHFN